MDRIVELLRFGPPIMVDKSLTQGGLILLGIVLLCTVVFLFLYARREPHWLKHYLTVAVGVFVFEVFTSPMWVNNHLGAYGYLYQDVSWVLTLGWTTLMLSVVFLVDTFWGHLHAWKRFLGYIGLMGIFGFLAEVLVMNLGLRSYAVEVEQAISGAYLWNTPLDTFYYVPVFSALVLGLYMYWTLIIDNRAVVTVQAGWLRKFVLSIVAVLLFELMIEPMVINANFPEWSYFFHDMSFILTLGWVLLVWLAQFIVDALWPNFNLKEKFFLSVGVIGVLALPFETYLIAAGYRIYEGTSAGNAFSGVLFPFIHTPMEVVVAIPMYFALVLGFIMAWEAMLVNPLVKKESTTAV